MILLPVQKIWFNYFNVFENIFLDDNQDKNKHMFRIIISFRDETKTIKKITMYTFCGFVFCLLLFYLLLLFVYLLLCQLRFLETSCSKISLKDRNVYWFNAARQSIVRVRKSFQLTNGKLSQQHCPVHGQ